MAALLNFVLFIVVICQTTRAEQYGFQVLADSYYYSDGNENNMCSIIQEYEDKIVVPVNVTVEEKVTKRCWAILRCSKKVNVTKTVNRTYSVLKTRTVFDCCQGYKRVSKDTCKPVCARGCIHGNCTQPEHCECEVGWEGVECTKECNNNWYGRNCDIFCSCFYGATCDRFNGTCYCTPEYTGKFCEIARLDAISGKCNETVKGSCKNGGTCRSEDNVCICLPGYQGTYCENLCEEGTFGDNCSGICTCDKDRTEICSPVNGKCQCLPGFRGRNCNKPCELGTWGRHCEQNCSCGSNGTCHHVSGACSCPPGWHGVSCEEKCPLGYFEKDCKMKCPDCFHEPGTCHHETGWCNCPPGKTGNICHLECPRGKFGANCNEFCLCNHNSTCDSVTGTCSCTPGWTGTFCSTACPEGSYGVNCSLTCNCSICNNEDGSCIKEFPELMDQFDSVTIEEMTFYPGYVNGLLGFFILIFLGLVLTAVIWKLSKTSYASNLYENVRKRFEGRHFFRAPDLRKEDSSTSNVFQEEVPTINPSGQFMNPLYYATEGIAKSNSRPTSTVHPIYDDPTFETHETNQNLPNGDNFEDLDFSIPESELGSPPEKSEIRISFGNDTQTSKNSAVTVNYCNPGKTYFFPEPVKKLQEPSNNDMVINEHRYENITEDVIATIPKE
ncbi:hypothetical protein JTE90_011818 [Oedothorax gibbosus]|uniref:Uncharacterized protein n=1 Tax=Oedothorax gibbosus TaxID=931172 RepID=A0AAV6VTD1_9ARAC|nr:hypothetical protein JTE90_011818 [Oedothorax gibbosus]